MVGWGWSEHELVRNEESLDDGTISLFLADDSSSLCFSWQDMRMDETSFTRWSYGVCGIIICTLVDFGHRCNRVSVQRFYERCNRLFACVADSILLKSFFFPARDRIRFVNQLPYLDL